MVARLAALFVFVLAGAEIFPEYPLKPIRLYPNSVTRDGLTIAAHAVSDFREHKKYFGIDLRKKGFVPILIVARNEDSERSFVIAKSEIAYATGAIDVSAKKKQVSATVADTLTTVASGFPVPIHNALAYIPATTFGRKIAANRSEIQLNLIKRELQSGTLAPGESMHGFLYIKAQGPLRVVIPVDGVVFELVP